MTTSIMPFLDDKKCPGCKTPGYMTTLTVQKDRGIVESVTWELNCSCGTEIRIKTVDKPFLALAEKVMGVKHGSF